MIKVHNLSKSFGSFLILDDINLELQKGRIYGFVGKNGSGKTTLFKCIAGLEEFRGGIVSDYDSLKNHTGLLLAEPYFIAKMTAREYVILMCNARDVSSDEIDRQNIFELPLDRYASQYSTGMKKKLALFAILLQKNDFFILDEPFNGVDIQSNMIISELLKKLKELGKIVIISSHIFSSLTDICDEISWLKDGQTSPNYNKGNFELLEAEMKTSVISDRISLLNLE
ncbi:ABC transporter ATP-binding protein [Marivirga sp.]|uniref:ABC transporter ATP-binding protein n=1 Tax=Marivirga sp. TaxID=2018662 RepID=UPI002D7EB681|nr:ABC transporter ATP-binding protein [Marivirga sp.]HET8858386.1 ABC transporter ATP-binding protein [Marivirga sp.]